VFNALMHLVSAIFVPLFLVGMAGSAVVCVITVAHDIKDFFDEDVVEENARDGGL
jgi:hypothetical protein